MSVPEVGTRGKRPIRWILSQIVAASAQNLTLLDLGMAISFSTILIPALLGAEGSLSFTKEQASWFGSINFILQPVGSVLSGPICEKLGRKRSLLVANLPHMAAWVMIYFAQNVTTLFCANAILGLGTGFMEAPILTYIGEISHASVRGFMTAYAEVFAVFGIFLAYLLGTLMPWRDAAITCLIFPLTTLVVAISIPESPVWLLTKGRKDEALKALCWVRGWKHTTEVQKEFEELTVYQKISAQCSHCNKPSELPTPTDCPHRNLSWCEKSKYNMMDMTRKEIMRPLCLALLMFFIQQTTGITAIRPNMVNIYNSFGMGVSGHFATVVTGLIGIIGTIAMMVLVKKLGKRFLNLMSLIASVICTLLLGLYAYIVLPHDASSYSPEKITTGSNSWLPITLFIVLNLTVSAGIGIMPWMMLSEIFPLRGRGTACGIAAAFCYMMNSIVSKLYFDVETALGIFGVMWLFCGFSVFGVVTMYFLMPETEGKPFEEIEKDFAGEKIPIFANDCLSQKVFKNRCVETSIHKHDYINNNISTVEKEVKEFQKAAFTENSKL